MRYISTRGSGTPQSFTDILLAGTAPDGGLYVPEAWPLFEPDFFRSLQGLSYKEIAFRVLGPFIADSIAEEDMDRILSETYEGNVFEHQACAPLVQIDQDMWIMELFHGPTLSFKDYALQFLGRLFDHVLEQRGERITIVGATSGDTGSAAIEACRGCKHIDIFILHPHERTSPIQRRQMTTVDAPNVFNIALEGNFDDCQALVKTLFADQELNQKRRLAAVNSINWARIMAQTVYYVTSAVALGAPDRRVSYAVPTGNFGNIFAAWVARKIGLPIHQLVIASNRNDILTRFFETGAMTVEAVNPSLSPSMDIQVSSNFERFLCEMLDRDHKKLASYMNEFKARGEFRVESNKVMDRIHGEMKSYRCDDEGTLAMMRQCYEATGEFIDPHTAVGLTGALQAQKDDPEIPMVSLACAHPAKFPDAVQKALGLEPPMPERLAAVLDKEERFTVLPHDVDAVRSFVLENGEGS